MPPAAFQDLWNTVKKGEKWQIFVKNLRKNGGYYWVKATVIPNISGEEHPSLTCYNRAEDNLKTFIIY